VLIDWFTVAAQIVNFLVLMALLKIFLYDRVIQAMDDRERKITSRLEDAEHQRREAEEDRQEAAAEKESLEAKREELLNQAREAARSKREELERQARSAVDDLKARWVEALDDEKERLARNLQNQAVQYAMTIARRVVADMAGDDFQERLVTSFMTRVHNLDGDEKRSLADNLDQGAPAAAVVSARELSTAQRQKVTRLLHEEIEPDLEVDYREDESLLGGIELRVPGKKVSWSPRRYLEDLEDAVLQTLTARSSSDASREPGEEDQEAEAEHER